jgi:transcriptional regulator with GAF, ATPase, and Fis domain/tetratricopeptide (TPR) repeat protein
MNEALPHLSVDQWNFLSVLHAFGGSLPIDIAGVLAPIAPGPFFDLTGRNNNPCLIYEAAKDHYTIIPDLPSKTAQYLNVLNDADRVYKILKKLLDSGLIDKLNPSLIKIMLSKLNDEERAAEIEIYLGRKLVEKKEAAAAFTLFDSAVRRLFPIAQKNETLGRLFIGVITEFIEIWNISGKAVQEPITYLKRAIEISMALGDKRSRALLYLELSHFFELIGKYEEMWEVFSIGYQSVKELGDNDILLRTASVLGTNFFHQGLFGKAIEHFEKMMPNITLNEFNAHKKYKPFRNIYEYGLCLIFSGRSHEAMGYLHIQYSLAKENSDRYVASFAKNMMGVALLMIKDIVSAKRLFKSALKEAREMNNLHLLYILKINFAYIHFLEGKFEKARSEVTEVSVTGQKLGAIHYPIASYILEMLFELEQLGFSPDPQFNYKDHVKMIINGVNAHFKGTVLRLEAISMLKKNEDTLKIEQFLLKSEQFLKQSGDLIQLGKTRLEMARLNLKNNRIENAGRLVQKAFEDFGDYSHLFFPEELKYLLKKTKAFDKAELLWKSRYRNSLHAYDSISTHEDIASIKFKSLRAICSMSKAERAVVFWFDSKEEIQFESVLSYNITLSEIKTIRFLLGKNLIIKALETKKKLIWRNEEASNENAFAIKSILCLPFIVDEHLSGVLYLDNLFLNDGYDAVDSALIEKIIKQSIFRIDQAPSLDYCREIKSLPDFENSAAAYPDDELLFGNPIMAELISEVDKVASTDSAVLITGETGTGKELLARKIHRVSLRKHQPFVVVDLTGIPDNLLESELFGYEKGAFTGADILKRGRIELAHQGTLFLDEIGEITPSFQVKLLRTLQEKIVTRVGGTQPLPVDFRLIAATNRNLKEEVASGNFREDLFYRLNVFPITLPPLRERQSDILLIARHFISKFAKKLNRSPIRMTSEDESWLMAYSWPGNIRELRNVIERAVILSSNGLLNLNMINNAVVVPVHQRLPAVGYLPLKTEAALISEGEFPALDEIQRRYIQRVLAKTNGKISGKGGAAEILKMKYSTLYAKMKKLGLR